MKKVITPLLILSSVALAACSLTSTRKVKRRSNAEYDSDPISHITSDETSKTSADETHEEQTQEEQEIVVPSEEEREVVENGVEISAAGQYTLKGEYTGVSITAPEGSEIYIYLDGVNINAKKAISSDNAIVLHFVLINESTNTFISTKATIDVVGELRISGKGILNVQSSEKKGIKATTSLMITQTTVNVTSADDGIKAEKFIAEGCKITINCQGDGIQTECLDSVTSFTANTGYVYLKDVDLTITGTGDGIQADTYVDINGGTINITTTGTFVSYSEENKTTYELTNDDYKWNSSHKRVASDSIHSYTNMYALANSVKAIKVGPIKYEDTNPVEQEVTNGDYLISIRGLANVTLNSTDDAIHTNYGNVSIGSANLNITTSDDGIHADYNTVLENTSIVINDSYEGIEGQNVTIDGEATNIVVTSQDDGVNAASDYGSSYTCNINNGYLRVKAGGDGLDANTTLNINGGTVIIEGPGSGNGSLDADQINVKGGIVFACSNNGMIESGFSATQPTFIYNGSSLSANSVITITDSSDNALYTYTLKLSCSQIIFSHPDMKVGSTYTIFNGDNVVTDISMTSTLTRIGSSSGGGPGGGGFGPGGW